MPARATRVRALAALALTLATLVLTGCKDGEGLRDEGPAHADPHANTRAHTAAHTHQKVSS
ncbi:hypothetical protein [Streptomyces sp. NPDC046862]|uniref:hypothetical protein n=1 Tax=Streptomyces sp. NPDC046862 TaxID=3154603 RepID=UPI003452D69B